MYRAFSQMTRSPDSLSPTNFASKLRGHLAGSATHRTYMPLPKRNLIG